MGPRPHVPKREQLKKRQAPETGEVLRFLLRTALQRNHDHQGSRTRLKAPQAVRLLPHDRTRTRPVHQKRRQQGLFLQEDEGYDLSPVPNCPKPRLQRLGMRVAGKRA